VAYSQLEAPKGIPDGIARFVAEAIDPRFAEFEYLLTLQMPGANEKGSLQLSLTTLVCALADGCAQVLFPGVMRNGERFQGYLLKYYPWKLDAPDGLTPDEACTAVWDKYRNPTMHRFGINKNNPLERVKFGRIFSQTPETIEKLRQNGKRPYSDPFIKRGNGRIVLWIDAFYWGLRMAAQAALADRAGWPVLEHHISSEAFTR
jgi:hypothetical protein